jgi:hypothetical protein
MKQKHRTITVMMNEENMEIFEKVRAAKFPNERSESYIMKKILAWYHEQMIAVD